jgi:hypothetical protein
MFSFLRSSKLKNIDEISQRKLQFSQPKGACPGGLAVRHSNQKYEHGLNVKLI